MKPCKRIEIVIETPLARQLTELLRNLGAAGFTMIPEIQGSGERGVRRGDELSGDTSNCLILIACDDQARVDAILEGVRPLLSRSGGVCLVSDALWLRH
jgi:nitrogen regulatory protein PII